MNVLENPLRKFVENLQFIYLIFVAAFSVVSGQFSSVVSEVTAEGSV